ncbi:hypothetical protein AB0425_15285 [Actinosynnema sp. NPDC051121]
MSAIAFDTKVKVGWLPGSAAKAITKRLRRLRFTVSGAPVSCYVGGTPRSPAGRRDRPCDGLGPDHPSHQPDVARLAARATSVSTTSTAADP